MPDGEEDVEDDAVAEGPRQGHQQQYFEWR